MKDLKKEELELMSYSDIAELILKDNSNPLTTADLFKKICNALELSDNFFENKVGDFYTALTTDKRFLLLDNGCWDLKENHSVKKLKLDESFDDLDDEELEDVKEEDSEDDYEEENMYDDSSDDDNDDLDEYKDLVIVDEEELESGE